MPFGSNAFGCVAFSSSSGLMVGGAYYTTNTATNAVYLFTKESATLTKISTMEAATKGKECAKLKLSTGKSAILCTVGIKAGERVETGETYRYVISAETFERKSEWDFPNNLISGATRAHVIGDTMLLQTALGMFWFKDNETSTETIGETLDADGSEF